MKNLVSLPLGFAALKPTYTVFPLPWAGMKAVPDTVSAITVRATHPLYSCLRIQMAEKLSITDLGLARYSPRGAGNRGENRPASPASPTQGDRHELDH